MLSEAVKITAKTATANISMFDKSRRGWNAFLYGCSPSNMSLLIKPKLVNSTYSNVDNPIKNLILKNQDKKTIFILIWHYWVIDHTYIFSIFLAFIYLCTISFLVLFFLFFHIYFSTLFPFFINFLNILAFL